MGHPLYIILTVWVEQYAPNFQEGGMIGSFGGSFTLNMFCTAFSPSDSQVGPGRLALILIAIHHWLLWLLCTKQDRTPTA